MLKAWALIASAVVVTALIEPPTIPSAPLLLTKTENDCDACRPATLPSRSISWSTSWNSASRVEREVALVWPDAACVARVDSRSSSLETLSSAPSLICRSDRPSLALRTPWLSTAIVER